MSVVRAHKIHTPPLLRKFCVAFVALSLATAVLGSGIAWAQAAAPTSAASATSDSGGASLETAATRAGDTARNVAFSMIGLALAVGGVVLCFKRDFKEAIGLLAIGVIAVLLASPAGLSLLQDTVLTIFG